VHRKVHFFDTHPATPQKKGGDDIKINEISGGKEKTLNQNSIGYVRQVESGKVSYSDVLYIEQRGNTVYITCKQGVLTVPGRMRDISKVLKEPFFQCHSYLTINFDRVYCMRKNQIIFDNKDSISLGRSCFVESRKMFNKYLLGQ